MALAVVGLAGLIWAFLARQFQDTEAAAKHAVDSDSARDSVEYMAPRRSSRGRRAAIGIALILVFASIAGSLMLTVVDASTKPKTNSTPFPQPLSPPGKGETSTPLKCPFQ